MIDTVFGYRNLMTRINAAIGHLKLADIRPQHLNSFYKNLSESGIRNSGTKATTTKDLGQLLKKLKISRAALSHSAGISPTTVTTACRGLKISQEKAQQIAAALDMKVTDLFKIERTIHH
jgi:integrase